VAADARRCWHWSANRTACHLRLPILLCVMRGAGRRLAPPSGFAPTGFRMPRAA
jgi:hypothetical protein